MATFHRYKINVTITNDIMIYYKNGMILHLTKAIKLVSVNTNISE